MTKRQELLARREKIVAAMDNILEGGQEFQTRTGRVKQVNYELLKKELNDIDTELAFLDDGSGNNGGNAMDEMLRIRVKGGGRHERCW